MLESLVSHRCSSNPEHLRRNQKPQQDFLHYIHMEHSRISQAIQTQLSTSQHDLFSSSTAGPAPGSIPLPVTPTTCTITVKETELHSKQFEPVDYSNFTLPPQLLLSHDPSQITHSPMLPLLRCIGIAHTLRLLSALLCERRIILVSHSSSRLSACASAAISILTQGLLYWQHIYIPILPPSMLNYLAAPMPYLIGVLGNHASDIRNIHGLGEVLVVLLDQNDLQTHNMTRPDMIIPDMLQSVSPSRVESEDPSKQYPNIADILKMDLLNVMKTDRKLMTGDSASGTAAVAGKGKDLLKRGIGKIGKVVKKQMDKQKSKHMEAGAVDDEEVADSDVEPYFNDMYAFTEGFDNEMGEEEARAAFAIFFLCFVGDVKWYLEQPQGGRNLKFDKDLFLGSRIRFGDHQNSPMYPLILHFKETQVFEQFASARVNDIQLRKKPTVYASLFAKVQELHNLQQIAFSGHTVRNSVYYFMQQNPTRSFIQVSSSIRVRAMSLTSNTRNESQVETDLSRIVQDCRESGSVLQEVMSVIWERLSDCRGMQWKHGLYSLQLLMELILHGPISAISEATDGLNRIRQLMYYQNMRPLIVQDIRTMANSIYVLLINRSRLFNMRRVCALRRLETRSSFRKIPSANRNLRIKMPFTMAHSLVQPTGMTPSPNGASNFTSATVPHHVSLSKASSFQQESAPTSDLLGIDLLTPEPVSQSSQAFVNDTSISSVAMHNIPFQLGPSQTVQMSATNPQPYYDNHLPTATSFHAPFYQTNAMIPPSSHTPPGVIQQHHQLQSENMTFKQPNSIHMATSQPYTHPQQTYSKQNLPVSTSVDYASYAPPSNGEISAISQRGLTSPKQPTASSKPNLFDPLNFDPFA